MKQPKLGAQIASLRRAKGMTQEELCAACGLNIRSLQRIESGEVSPRTYTLKLLSRHLDYDLWSQAIPNEDQDSHHETVQALKWAWIAGIGYFVLTIPDIIFVMARNNDGLDELGVAMYVSTSLAVMLTAIFFFRGFIVLGKKLNQNLLTISAYVLIALTIVIYSYDMMTIWWDLSREVLIIVTLLTIGSAGIFFGLGLSRLESKLGTSAKAAAILELITGICFVLVIPSFIGLITILPAIFAEVILLYKAYNMYREPTAKLSLGNAS